MHASALGDFQLSGGQKSREVIAMVHSDNGPIHKDQVLKNIQSISESSE
jgi:ABC-type enterochelin transport system ATPase subunit